MHFMADIEVVCEECNGRRFGPRVLAAKYRGKTIQDVFEMTIREALEFFTKSNAIRKKLQPFADVGLGYLKLGQATSTLSGGEAQRVKLASYIGSGKSRQSTDKPIAFIFDEPTIGLHLLDIETLLKALRQLIQAGDSVFVIEHNIDFIANCDWVIDLGPGAGPDGGKIVAEGPPKEIANNPESLTGQYLGASV
jgi:excinuclease ABC subunit A